MTFLLSGEPPPVDAGAAQPGPANQTRADRALHGRRGHRVRHGDEGWSREEALAALEGPERRRVLDPERVWDRVGLPVGAVVVDVGAGTGYFALPAARRVGPAGRVYATDISADMVELLRERAAAAKLPQLRPVLNSADCLPLRTGSADLVLLATVLHDISRATMAEAARLLRPEGRLVNLDWSTAPSPFGPPPAIRLAPLEAARLLSELDLRLVETFDPGPYHYAQIFRRSGGSRSDPGDG